MPAFGPGCAMIDFTGNVVAGFIFSGGVFLALSRWLTDEQFFSFGWRIPFLASAVLVFVGLYVRLTITETPVFQNAVSRSERVKVPLVVVLRDVEGLSFDEIAQALDLEPGTVRSRLHRARLDLKDKLERFL